MSLQVAARTITPIFSLMALGYLSRLRGVLRAGDERVFSSYLYYFGLPALLTVDLSETALTREAVGLMALNLAPMALILLVLMLAHLVFRLERETLILLIVVASFGSLGFYGLPFVSFALPSIEAERLATLSVASINSVGFILTVLVLEAYRGGSSAFREVASSLARNPLILSILAGMGLSAAGVSLPAPIASGLHMIGASTSPVAIFMLGVFLYGRDYGGLREAAAISAMRLVLLPAVAVAVCLLYGVPALGRTVMVLMYGTPLAVSMIVLSERYGFREETVSSVILVSSLAAGVTMNLWLMLLEIVF
jgi:malonate transporter